jgi:hypothetical protein
MRAIAVLAIVLACAVVGLADPPRAAKQIYPTKQNGGREWNLNEASPCSDHMFSPGKPIKKHSGGGWEITGEVRMGVNTLTSGNISNTHQWRDVEITGYVYVIEKFHSSYGSHFSFYGRGGKHTDCSGNLDCCDGSAYKGDLDVDNPGDVWVKKEVFHPKYTDKKGQNKTGAKMLHSWTGWKVAIYNKNNETVVVEGYIDKDATNNWHKAFTVTDTPSSHWSAHGEHHGCKNYLTGKQRGADDVLAWAGPVVTFRSDGLTWAFKELSVREICALGSQAECAKQDHRPNGCHNMEMGDKCAAQSCHVGGPEGIDVPAQWPGLW